MNPITPISKLIGAILLIGNLASTLPSFGAGCPDPEFAASRSMTWSGYPTSLVVTDFNGDAISDFATANYSPTGTVSVAIGKGDGTFQTNVDYSVGQNPLSIQAADLNGDGTNDLVVINQDNDSNHRVSVLLGKGDGTFQTNVFYAVSSPPFQVAVFDFDGDGIPDLMTAGSHFEVLYGNGDGTFQPATIVPGSAGEKFASADFNGDGTNDLVVTGGITSDEGFAQVFFNNGAGSLTPGTMFPSGGTNPTAVAVSDFNGDGTNDLALANFDTGNIGILLGQGGGVFGATVTHAIGKQPNSIAVGDFNGDGTNDLAVANTASNTVSVLLGMGDGNFQARVAYEVQTATSLGIGDFNSDGKPDLLVSGGGLAGYPNVTMLLGNGDGTFQDTPHYPTGPGPRTPLIADFNGDGKPDIAVPNSFTNTITILLNNGDGTYTTNDEYFSGINPYTIAAGDFNNDNKLDLIVANLNTNYASLFLGNGNGTFQAKVAVPLFLLGSAFAVAGDFNHDGKLDFAAPGVLGVQVFPGNNNGTFQAAVTSSEASFLANGTGADLNGDGNTDLIITTGANYLTVLMCNGNSTFQAPLTNSAGTALWATAVGDLNGDGNLDIAAADAGDSSAYPNGKIQVFLGNGNGTFQPAVGYLVDPSMAAYSVAIGDVNGDGKPDLIVGSVLTRDIWVMLNNGNGTFQHGVPFGVGTPLGFVAVGDANADGHLDVLAGNSGSSSVSVLLNTCLAGGIGSQADIAIHKTDSPDPVTVGSNLTYTIVVTNLGAATAASVTVTDALPSSVTFVSASAGCTNIGGIVVCDLGDLINGGSVTKTITVATTITGSITNTAVISSTTDDPNSANNTATAITTVQQEGGGGGGSLVGTLSKVKEKCKTKNNVTTCKLGAGLALLNSGDALAPATHVRFFLSTDANYDDGVDTMLGEATTKTIKPGKSGKAKLKTVTDASSAGLFILAVDDDGNVLASFQVPAP